MMHTFSYIENIQVQRLVRRPWWAFWRHDSLVAEAMQRRNVLAVTQQQADWIQANSEMLHELFGWCDLQLDTATFATPYIPTNSQSVFLAEPMRGNLMRNSFSHYYAKQ